VLLEQLIARLQAAMVAPASAIPKIVVAEAGNFPDIARFYLEEVIQRGLRLFRRVLKAGMARGEFADGCRKYGLLRRAPMMLACCGATRSRATNTYPSMQTHCAAPMCRSCCGSVLPDRARGAPCRRQVAAKTPGPARRKHPRNGAARSPDQSAPRASRRNPMKPGLSHCALSRRECRAVGGDDPALLLAAVAGLARSAVHIVVA